MARLAMCCRKPSPAAELSSPLVNKLGAESPCEAAKAMNRETVSTRRRMSALVATQGRLMLSRGCGAHIFAWRMTTSLCRVTCPEGSLALKRLRYRAVS